MSIWTYYTRLAIADLFRLWSSTQHHVIIVAGICLPILLLLGLKAGHVAELRQELLTSPTGRQVIVYSAQSDSFITADFADELMRNSPNVELVIPESQRLVLIRRKPADDQAPPTVAHRVTLYPTRPGDPILAQAGADVLSEREPGLVLTKTAAVRLGVRPGDVVEVRVERRKSRASESATTELRLRSVVEFGAEDESVGYVPLTLLTWIEQYVRGFQVDELGWPALEASVQDRYGSYLLFCRFGNDLTAEDKSRFADLDLILKATVDPRVKSLYGLIRPDAVDQLIAYEVCTAHSREDYKHRMSMAPTDLSINLIGSNADPVVIPWNAPVDCSVGDRTFPAVGVSISERNWLRDYLVDRGVPFGFDADDDFGRFVRNGTVVAAPGATFVLPLRDGQWLELKAATPVEPEPVEPGPGKPAAADREDAPQSILTEGSKTPPAIEGKSSDSTPNEIVVLPADLLARIDAHRAGSASFDGRSRLFVPVPEAIRFDKARVYATSIDEVPQVVATLLERNVAVESENGRIMEIHEQDRSLQLLVYVVGAGVFLFGIVTVFSVLLDSTDRKRSAIGILRVMGVSRGGIFYIVILRAMLIGLLAGLVTVAVGCLVAWFLALPAPADSPIARWKPTISILVDVQDVLIVFGGALLVAGVGAFIPALRASRMDPFDAIVEGRFR